MAQLTLRLLGGFSVGLGSGQTLTLGTKKARALLAYLAVPAGRAHPRDKLASLLWGDTGDEQARQSLRQTLLALRRALPATAPPILVVDHDTLALDPAVVEVDVRAFERLAAERTATAIADGVALYQGDLLEGVRVTEEAFEDWLRAERARLRQLAVEALVRLLALQNAGGETERAMHTAARLLALDPVQEIAHRALMRLYARQGRRGEALRQYQKCVSALRREVGAEPEAETRHIYQELLRRPADAVGAFDAQADHRSRPARTVARSAPDLPAAEAPLFGRHAELGQLRQLLEEAVGGCGRMATVVGEAGIGKTRLVSALATDALSRGCRVLIGHCHESDAILAFAPWVGAFRSAKVSTDEEILGALDPAWRAELTRLFPEASVADLPRASDSALPLFESVTRLVERLAAREPVVLILEDAHWADEMSLRLLAFVSRRIPTWAALLVTTARGEELVEAAMARGTVEELSRPPQGHLVRLPPLSRPDAALLVRALSRVGSDAATAAQVEEQIWVASEGNPFVAVEAVRALDQGSVDDRACGESRRRPLPERVRDLVARRLDRLSGRGQQLAAVAAVIGRRFDFTLLQSASGMHERDAAEAVEEMVCRGVLQAVGNQLDFTHDRVRDVAYGRLLPLRRRLFHRAVAEALDTGTQSEAHAGARIDEQIEQLARHALQGELREKAVHYLRQAGLKATARSALADARAWFEQALSVLESLPESQASLEQGFEIRLELRPLLLLLGEVRQTLARLGEAEALARRLKDEGRRNLVGAFVINAHSLLGELDEALVAGRSALQIAGRLGDLRLRIATRSTLAVAHYFRGEYERVVELATDNLAELPDEWVHEHFGLAAPPSVYDRAWLVLSLAELGRFAEAAEHEAEAIRLAEPTHHAYTVGLANWAAGALHLLEGNWREAHSRFEHRIAVLHKGGNVLLPSAIAFCAWVLAQLGQATEARDRLQECDHFLDRREKGELGATVGLTYHALGRARLLLDQLDEARSLAGRALDSSPSQAGVTAHVHHLLGDIATHADRFDAEGGEAHYRQALALAEPRGMRPLVAHCHLGLGQLYRRRGQRVQAKQHLGTAVKMYHEMEMRFWEELASEPSKPR